MARYLLNCMILLTGLLFSVSCSVHHVGSMPSGIVHEIEGLGGDSIFLVVILNSSDGQTETACGVFDLPDFSPMPTIPPIPEAMRNDHEAIANLLIDHIIELRHYDESQKYVIKEVYREYLYDCQ